MPLIQRRGKCVHFEVNNLATFVLEGVRCRVSRLVGFVNL